MKDDLNGFIGDGGSAFISYWPDDINFDGWESVSMDDLPLP